jgi:hypothetical protein
VVPVFLLRAGGQPGLLRKHVLIDMSDLTGIYQSLSFIGLGIVLLGVGWLYQRPVFAGVAPTTLFDLAARAPAHENLHFIQETCLI